MLNEIYVTSRDFYYESQGNEEQVSLILISIKGKIPKHIDLEKAKEKYPINYQDSMNTVLHSEIYKYNVILDIV